MGIIVTSGSLCVVMVAHCPRMPEMWILSPALGTVFPIFVTPMTIYLGLLVGQYWNNVTEWDIRSLC